MVTKSGSSVKRNSCFWRAFWRISSFFVNTVRAGKKNFPAGMGESYGNSARKMLYCLKSGKNGRGCLTIPAPYRKISVNHSDTLLCHRSTVRCPYILLGKDTHYHGNDQSSHLIRLYGAASRAADPDGAPYGGAALVLRRLRLHSARHAHHRSERCAARQGRRRDRKADLPFLQGRQRPFSSLRPDGASGEIRCPALCRPCLPVPPLPDR